MTEPTKKKHSRSTASDNVDLRELDDAQLLSRLIGLKKIPVELEPLARETFSDLLWRDPAAPLSAIEKKQPGIRFLLTSAIDLVRAVSFDQLDLRDPLGDPEALVRYLFLSYSRRRGDALVTFFLDDQGRWLDDRLVFFGDTRRDRVRLSEVLGPAVECGAAYLALFHVRPDGTPRPTAADVERTIRVRLAARVLGMELLDSWIVVGPRYWTGGVGRFSGQPVAIVPENDEPAEYDLAWSDPQVLWRQAVSLATVLGRGRLTQSAMKRARNALLTCRGTAGVVSASPETLHRLGLHRDEVDRLRVVAELGRRLSEAGHRESPVVRDAAGMAQRLLARGSAERLPATGALLLDERGAILKVRVLEPSELSNRCVAARAVLADAVVLGATRLVPFLYKTASSPEAGDFDAEFYGELEESRHYFGMEMPEVLYVFSTGHYLSRETGGRLRRVEGAADHSR